MTNYQNMSMSFEREKNTRALLYTLTICVALFLLFFFLQWTLPQIPPPDFGEGIEVNLGNSETGSGNIAPQLPGEPTQQQESKPIPSSAKSSSSQPPIKADAYDDGDAPAINKTKPVPVSKTEVHPAETPLKKATLPVSTPVKEIPKPKAVFTGGAVNKTGGNNADSYKGVMNQGIAGGKGDQGKPNGNPNSDSYQGNAASGNGGNVGNSGVRIRSGLSGRGIVHYPSFEDDFNENAKVAVDITVDKAGNVLQASVNQKGTTTTNHSIWNIAIQKAKTLKLNAGEIAEQTGTLVFNFKLR
jgi:hypothetical protein